MENNALTALLLTELKELTAEYEHRTDKIDRLLRINPYTHGNTIANNALQDAEEMQTDPRHLYLTRRINELIGRLYHLTRTPAEDECPTCGNVSKDMCC